MKEAEGAIAASAQNAADLFGCVVVIYTGSVCEFGQWRATYPALAFLCRKNIFIVFYRKAILTQQLAVSLAAIRSLFVSCSPSLSRRLLPFRIFSTPLFASRRATGFTISARKIGIS